jgi:CRISPR/Cas system CSM-associated protein Csm2 small subunit
METTRAKVIEKAVGFEESISQLLSILMEIDKNSSKSFGSKSFALSFNAKINLLVDLKFIPKEISSDFQLFTEIRNKFAHVLDVDSFVKCFEIMPKNRNNFLKKSRKDISKIDKKDEAIYATCFEILCFELGIWLRISLKMISNKKSQNLKKTGVVEMIRGFLQDTDKDKKEDWDAFFKTLKPLIEKIKPDDEFLEDYRNLLKEAEEKPKLK